MATSKLIKIENVHVNTENYRFEPVASQKEAIDKMVEDQNSKLFNLAEDIVQNGLNPNDKIQVVSSSHNATKYNVVEGNRRIVTLKLLNNPDLIDNSKHAGLKKKFKELHDKNKSAIPKEFECTVYDNPAEADKWIKLKHAGQSEGVGTVVWTALQVQRFEEKVEGKSSIALQTMKLLQNSPDVPKEIKSELGNLKVTNLDRLLSDPDVRDMLGIEINNGILQSEIEEKEVIKGLAQIAKDLLDTKFNVKRIYTKEDRKDYIKDFPKATKPNAGKKATKPWQFNVTPTSSPKPQPPKPKPNPKDRNVLIPKTCALKINNPKVNALYHEFQKLKLSDFTNVAAASFRVFVELSIDCFIEGNKITKTKDGKQLDLNSNLMKKVIEVANYLEDNKLAAAQICKGIRSAVNNKDDLLGIETLHAYVHNAKFSPIASHLVITWDNIQPFIEKVWENIK